jgi:ribonuclease E
MRLWENVRSLTLQSSAPALVYEEGSLIKRSVRDLYNKDIDEILVSGDEGYREAKDFMRMLMPSHAKVVQPYRDATPIFARAGIEAQLDRMVQPQVTLKSGGYLIINQTEALVAIDVNSGRSTREHNIEDTALQTNLEAAEEVARQLRLRDLAGLIVIDFIDMEENRNNRAVEKKLKDCLKNDRARIQVGRISHFGLMEMSRQRIRASVLESTMKPCPHCGGTGHVRSDSSVALLVVRGIEEFLLKDSRHHITVKTPVATALYVLNHKRSTLVEMEQRFGVTIAIEADDSVSTQHYVIVRGAVAEKPEGFTEVRALPFAAAEEPEDDETDEAEETAPRQPERQADQGEGQRKRRRRRRRRGGRDRDGDQAAPTQDDGDVQASEDANEDAAEADATEASAEDTSAKKRRRGKRGGKRNRREDGDAETVTEEASGEQAEAQAAAEPEAEAPAPVEADSPVAANDDAPEQKPKRTRRTAKAKKAAEETVAEPAVTEAKAATGEENGPDEKATTVAAEEAKPKARSSRRKTSTEQAPAEPVVSSVVSGSSDEAPAAEKPKRGGWWQRKGFF